MLLPWILVFYLHHSPTHSHYTAIWNGGPEPRRHSPVMNVLRRYNRQETGAKMCNEMLYVPGIIRRWQDRQLGRHTSISILCNLSIWQQPSTCVGSVSFQQRSLIPDAFQRTEHDLRLATARRRQLTGRLSSLVGVFDDHVVDDVIAEPVDRVEQVMRRPLTWSHDVEPWCLCERGC